MADFEDYRQQLADALDRLAAVGTGRASRHLEEGAAELAKRLADERFTVVVAGEFKRGKTTFVNALLGIELLPAAVVPLTSIVTAVTYAEEPRAEVRFLDGRREAIEPDVLERYVTERGNPDNKLGVDRALVRYPAAFLRGGVYLVDTPGVGSVYRRNTDAAYAFMPESDAAIFLTSADPPISESERSFLRDVQAESARMFFVLNKIDYLSERDRAESLAFTHEGIREAIGREAVVFPVSARQALEAKVAGNETAVAASGLSVFEEKFAEFLLRDKGAAIICSVGGHATALLANESNAIRIEEASLDRPLDELERTSADLSRVFDDARVAREDIKTLLRKAFDHIVEATDVDLDRLRRDGSARLIAEVQARVDEIGRRDVSQVLEEHIRSAIRMTVDRWRTEEERTVGARVADASGRFVGQANELVQRTIDLCAGILDVELDSIAAPVGLQERTRFTFHFFQVPTVIESLLPDMRGYLPKRFARKLLDKQIHARIPSLVDKHAGRMRWDFTQRLQSERISLERELDNRIETTIESLSRAITQARERTEATQDEVAQRRESLGRTAADLADLKASLVSLIEACSEPT